MNEVRNCIVYKCQSNYIDPGKRGKMFYPPKDDKRREKWFKNLNLYHLIEKPYRQVKHMRICRRHFAPEDFRNNKLIKLNIGVTPKFIVREEISEAEKGNSPISFEELVIHEASTDEVPVQSMPKRSRDDEKQEPSEDEKGNSPISFEELILVIEEASTDEVPVQSTPKQDSSEDQKVYQQFSMRSQRKMVGEIGRAAYELKAIPSWAEENNSTEDLQDCDNRIDDVETDKESDHSDHETESEQSGEDDPYENDDSVNSFIGKDKSTIWHTNPPCKNIHTPQHNNIIHVSKVTAIAKNAKSPIDCWKLFFSDSLLDKIVCYTNLYLDRLRPNYGRSPDYRQTDFAEIHAVFGILYMAGVLRAQHLNLKELWATDGTAPECFRTTMSRERFLLLLRAIRFDNFENRILRKIFDNLSPIREVLEDFISKCKENYQVGKYSTIDEMLEPFEGRCKFKRYIPNKRGIKIYALVDSCTFYTSNLEVYAGRQPDGLYTADNSPDEVVKRLTGHIMNTERNITMDNYFSSIPLAKELLDKKTTMVGTIRKNNKEIPARFNETKNRAVQSSLFGFIETGTLVSYKTKPNKNVLVFSTLHNNDRIDQETWNSAKTKLITFYNLTKNAVDVVDEMKALYSVARVSCRWPLTIFFALLNISGINSQIIYKENTNDLIDRRIFLKTLALSLMQPHLITRSAIPNMSLHGCKAMKRIACVTDSEIPVRGVFCEGFCAFCPRRNNKKTKKHCVKCKALICSSHTVYTCVTCVKEVTTICDT